MVNYIEILKREIIPAQGCTEPIAVAYATSLAAEQIGEPFERIDLFLSGNIIKNALGVGIPGTGKIGIDIAASLGAIIKNPAKKLEIISNISQEQLDKANKIVDDGRVDVFQKDTKEKLYIEATVIGKHHTAKVIIKKNHTNIVRVEKDGNILYDKDIEKTVNHEENNEKSGLTISGIYEFATTCNFEDIKFILNCVDMNKRVSKEGLENAYGLQVGKKIACTSSDKSILVTNEIIRILSRTCSASDARMGGCSLPIMTTAGSGNQGIACTLPVIELAELIGASEEKLARALVISNLVVVHMKEYMGRLSPICGAGIAGGTGACCGMTYLQGGGLPQISCAVRNMVATLSGMICDGAKETCALKIAAGTNAALINSALALNNITPNSKDGIISDDVEKTVANIGSLVEHGLKDTDAAILKIMLDKQIGGKSRDEKNNC